MRWEEAYEKWEERIGIHSYITIFEHKSSGKGLLSGLRISIKDNISTRGVRTTCASRMLANYVPPYDAKVVELLKKHGATLFSKTNMDEFAMGNSTETSFFGPTYNPWYLDRVPGGSSGGSATSVATGQVDASLGSDTGGSIRNPAAYCYVLGLKPTYGAVSRFGLIAYAESLEQIGPIARRAVVLAKVLYAISEADPRDGTMFFGDKRAQFRKSILAAIEEEVKPSSIYVPTDLVDLADQEVKSYFWKAIDYLQQEGFDVEEGNAESLHLALPAYYIIAMVEASSNLARYDGVKFGFRAKAESYPLMIMRTRAVGFGFEVKARILAGTFASAVGYKDRFYIRALKVRRRVKDFFAKVFERNRFFAIPTTPSVPPKFGESLGPKGYANDIYTVPANLAGIPALSVPCGLVNGSLPVAIQIMAPWYSDGELIKLAKLLEGRIYDPEVEPKGLGSKPKHISVPEGRPSRMDLLNEVKRISWLARIWIEGEEERYAGHFEMILNLFEEMDKMGTLGDVEPLYHPLELTLEPREDVPDTSMNTSQGLKEIAPDVTEDGYVRIPRMY